MAAAVARRYGGHFLAVVARRPNESAGDAISVYRLAFREALSRPGLTSGNGTEELSGIRIELGRSSMYFGPLMLTH